MAITGYYLPGSLSNSYVANKQNETGGYTYDTALNQIGIQEQAALQSLNKDYSQTIANAYNSYLSNKRGVMGSAMGQGYKEAYIENQRQQLLNDVSSANMNIANYRQQIIGQADQTRNQIGQQFQTEVMNIDRAKRSLNDFAKYISTLTTTDKEGNTINYIDSLDDWQKNALKLGDIDYVTDFLYGAQPQDYKDAEGNKGLSYTDWMETQMDPESDFYRWFRGQGGETEVRNQLMKQFQESETERAKYKEDYLANFKPVEINKINDNEYKIGDKIYSSKDNLTTTLLSGKYTSNEYKTEQSDIKAFYEKKFKTTPKDGEVIKYGDNYYVYREHTVTDTTSTRKPSFLNPYGGVTTYETKDYTITEWVKLEEKTQNEETSSTKPEGNHFGGGGGRGR